MGALWIQGIWGLFSRRKLFFALTGIFVGFSMFFFLRGVRGQTDASERVAIGIVNRDNSIYSRMLLSFYEENGLFTSYVSVYIGEQEEVQSWFEEGKLDMYLVIPEEFADSMTYLRHLPVQAVISTKKPAVEIMLKNLLKAYEKYISSVELHCVALYRVMLLSGMSKEQADEMNDRVSVQLILKALSKSDFFEWYILENYGNIELASFYLHEAALLLATFLALLAGVGFLQGHRAGIYARLVTMGISGLHILWQKEFFFGSLLAVGIVLFAVILNIAGISCPWQVFCLLFLYACLMGALMLFVAAALREIKNYLLASNMLLLLGTVLGGGLIPFMYLPAGMRTIARFLPNYNFLCLIFDARAGNLPARELFLVGVVCMGCAVMLLFLAGSLYGRGEGRSHGNT
ncbi:MAG: ABC transporter permease [Lachnospiraceae bacterium]|nr:ABC transporter permease [Lachnospiraceae bacterium]